ncbi:MAG: hypothetical protein MK105_15730 [Crocinitomicaceae bacterium]|nr:hypothetical protein [Crocinitomicaceae bacterium]
MNIDTCYKYFVFLNTECDRYLEDGEITDEEMHQLKIEFDKFIKEAYESDLPSELKNKIGKLSLKFEYKATREYGDMLGRWNFGAKKRRLRQENQVEELQYQIKGLPMFIKMNFEF